MSSAINSLSYPTEIECSNCGKEIPVSASAWNWKCKAGHENGPVHEKCQVCDKEPAENASPTVRCTSCDTIMTVPRTNAGKDMKEIGASKKHSVLKSKKKRPSISEFHCKNCNNKLMVPSGPWTCAVCSIQNEQGAPCSKCSRTFNDHNIICGVCRQETKMPSSKISDSLSASSKKLSSGMKKVIYKLTRKPFLKCPRCTTAINTSSLPSNAIVFLSPCSSFSPSSSASLVSTSSSSPFSSAAALPVSSSAIASSEPPLVRIEDQKYVSNQSSSTATAIPVGLPVESTRGESMTMHPEEKMMRGEKLHNEQMRIEEGKIGQPAERELGHIGHVHNEGEDRMRPDAAAAERERSAPLSLPLRPDERERMRQQGIDLDQGQEQGQRQGELKREEEMSLGRILKEESIQQRDEVRHEGKMIYDDDAEKWRPEEEMDFDQWKKNPVRHSLYGFECMTCHLVMSYMIPVSDDDSSASSPSSSSTSALTSGSSSSSSAISSSSSAASSSSSASSVPSSTSPLRSDSVAGSSSSGAAPIASSSAAFPLVSNTNSNFGFASSGSGASLPSGSAPTSSSSSSGVADSALVSGPESSFGSGSALSSGPSSSAPAFGSSGLGSVASAGSNIASEPAPTTFAGSAPAFGSSDFGSASAPASSSASGLVPSINSGPAPFSDSAPASSFGAPHSGSGSGSGSGGGGGAEFESAASLSSVGADQSHVDHSVGRAPVAVPFSSTPRSPPPAS